MFHQIRLPIKEYIIYNHTLQVSIRLPICLRGSPLGRGKGRFHTRNHLKAFKTPASFSLLSLSPPPSWPPTRPSQNVSVRIMRSLLPKEHTQRTSLKEGDSFGTRGKDREKFILRIAGSPSAAQWRDLRAGLYTATLYKRAEVRRLSSGPLCEQQRRQCVRLRGGMKHPRDFARSARVLQTQAHLLQIYDCVLFG